MKEKNRTEEAYEITACGRMNMWVGDAVRTYQIALEAMKAYGSDESRAELRGVIAGIRLLQDQWLKGTFDKKEDGK